MRFEPAYPLADLHPADYNPRLLTEEAFERLQESLRRFGVQKPVILNADGTLVAGHQRTKALRAIGVDAVPAIMLEKQVPLADEIRFNLMHNSIETEKTSAAVPELDEGWQWVEPGDVEVGQNQNAAVIKEICVLLSKYGAWGSIIADTNGVVIANTDYAFACKVLNLPVLAAVLTPERARELLQWLGGDYGVYSYGALGIKTYNQILCQPKRKLGAAHPTYERLVKPSLQKSERLVDFGAGEGKAVMRLLADGYDAFAYEPHLRKQGTDHIDVAGVVRQITQLRSTLRRNGQFNVVVLDAVLNSVTSMEFAHRVLTACNALCRKDGRFYTSTRSKGTLEGNAKATQWTGSQRGVEFLDPNGFSAINREGVWTLQLFMNSGELRALLSEYFEDVELHVGGKETEYLRATCRRPRSLDPQKVQEALDVEFNMNYPNGYHHDKQGPLVETLTQLVADRDR